MKIKILTFHCAKNYGAVLQAYALRQKLLEFSNDVSFINYCPQSLTSAFYNAHGMKSKARIVISKSLMLVRYLFGKYGTKIRKFQLFLRDYLCVKGEKITDKKCITEDDTDVIVLGSDQIWNVDITNGDTAYFGNFSKKSECKVISYAASIGKEVFSEKDKRFLQSNICDVDFISVREQTGKRILSKLTNATIDVVLDPTLLLTNSDWEKLAKEPTQNGYILLYCMDNHVETNRVADMLSAQTGLNIVEIFSTTSSLIRVYSHATIPSAGPLDFIGLFKNAKYVVTSSFHGMAFSIIFNKQFFVLPNGSVSSRMIDLLKLLNLSDRFITDINNLPDNEIDYSTVNHLLDEERAKSVAFLEKALAGVQK